MQRFMLSKTILYSNQGESIKETKYVSAKIFREILILLHPFIPFVTEEIWLKNKLDNSGRNFLMLSNWTSDKINKDKDYTNVEKLIKMIKN